MARYDLICCVVEIGNASKVIKCAKRYGVRGGTISIGRGTVHNRLLDILGITEVRKEVVTMIVEDELSAGVIDGISEDMQFHKPHHGIAFSYPVLEFIGSKNAVAEHNLSLQEQSGREQSGQEQSSREAERNVYKAIHVVVDKGKGGDVVEAANKAGARGATILNARGSGIHEVQKVFSIEIEPEKEEVFIIAKPDAKDSIVEAICTNIKIEEPGNGILFVLDINEVRGLHED